ncbi:Fanconi anemia core complex-associated protein 20 isoform X2 [Nothobranchius furzeri]|uniref:Transcript variant X2 n=1 Tax=Nothobranchius furzeri TaxID=105023 RepID=A0A9D2XXY6_NOTFU|nr:transcript variant X2 [Nothobranchius furzeri]
MTGKFPKSKLKRKRTSVEDVEPETSTYRGLPSASGTGGASTHREPDAGSGRSAAPSAPSAPAWWRTVPPGSAEALWAATLTSALPYLDKERWDPLPDLPPCSAAKPKNSDQERWCDLGSEVRPFPESSLRTPSSLASSQDFSGWTTPAAQPDRSPHLHTGSPRPLCRSQPPPAVRRGEEASSSSSSSAGRCGGQKAAPGNRELTQKVSDPSSPAEEEEEQGVRGDEEAELQSCPMCLQAFPVGSTQMDRDGHLAQCLSEMNMDMTW